MTIDLASKEDAALASDFFDQFANAQSFRSVLGLHRKICDTLRIQPTNFLDFYPQFKRSLRSRKAISLWAKLDKKVQQKPYEGGTACAGKKVLVIGCGPCGLRSAIEAQLLGAKVVVIEKRNKFSRNNVLHIWPFVIKDLTALGIKIFFGKFCVGSINHISIRQLQCILLKVALCLGVEVYDSVSYEGLVSPEADDSDIGWMAAVSPPDHPVNHFEFDMMIGANGKRAVFDGFTRKEFRGKLAIAITVNFVNNRTEQEARVEEMSGVAFIFNQKFFTDMCEQTGIDLENIVYYKDDTHYFVMTAKKHSLLWRRVLYNDYPDTEKLLAQENIDRDALYQYAYDAAMFATKNQLPDDLTFALNHYNEPDVAMFDFTSMFASLNASRILERNGKQLLMALVGDGLLEPFWPTGSGCARGFLGSFDACWMLKRWAKGEKTPLEVLAERESIYRLLAQTTNENLCKESAAYTLDPRTRYPNLNSKKVLPIHVKHLFDTDRPEKVETMMRRNHSVSKEEKENKRSLKALKSQESRLVSWFRRQLFDYPLAAVEDICTSFQTGQPLCALIHRYRPSLLEYESLNPGEFAVNCELAFDVLEGMGIRKVISGEECANHGIYNKTQWISYLYDVYLLFKGQIPHLHKSAQDAESADEWLDGSESKSKKARKIDDTSLMKRVKRRRRDSDMLPKPKPKPPPRSKSKRGEPVFDKKELEYLSRVLLVKTGGLKSEEVEEDELPSGGDDPKIDFDDMNLFLYRLESDFSDKQSKLDKMLFGGKENKDSRNSEIQRPSRSDDFSAKISSLQEKFKGNYVPDAKQKPKELVRAIGKIDQSDWNIQRLKQKAEHPKKSEQTESKVPQWNRDQYHDKRDKMLKIMDGRKDDSRFSLVDQQLKILDHKLKPGNLLDSNGMVSQAKQKFAKTDFKTASQDIRPYQEIAQEKAREVSSRLPTPRQSDHCYACKKPVYLVERLCVEGKTFHKKCLKCEYCQAGLKIGGYTLVRDFDTGAGLFYCPAHAIHHKQKVPTAAVAQPEKKPDLADRGAIKEKIYEPLPEPEEPERAAYEVLENSILPLPDSENYEASGSEESSEDESDESDYQDFTDESDQEEEEEEVGEEEEEQTPQDSNHLPASGEYDNQSSQPLEDERGDCTDDDVEDQFSAYENDIPYDPDDLALEDGELPPLRAEIQKEAIYENTNGRGLLQTRSGTNLNSLLAGSRTRVSYMPVHQIEPPPLAPRLPEVRSRLLSSTSSISEMQKLLNPAMQPSDSMQTFLRSADKLFMQPLNTAAKDDVYKQYAELPLQRSSSLVNYGGLGSYANLPKRALKFSLEKSVSPERIVVSTSNPAFIQRTSGVSSESTDSTSPDHRLRGNPEPSVPLSSNSVREMRETETIDAYIDDSPVDLGEISESEDKDDEINDNGAYSVVYDDVGIKNQTSAIMDEGTRAILPASGTLNSETEISTNLYVYDDIGNIRQSVEKLTVDLQSPTDCVAIYSLTDSEVPVDPPREAEDLNPDLVEGLLPDGKAAAEILSVEARGETSVAGFLNPAHDELRPDSLIVLPDIKKLTDSVVDVEKVIYDDIGNLRQSGSERESKFDEDLTAENSEGNKPESVDTEDEFSEIFSEEVGNLDKSDCESGIFDKEPPKSNLASPEKSGISDPVQDDLTLSPVRVESSQNQFGSPTKSPKTVNDVIKVKNPSIPAKSPRKSKESTSPKLEAFAPKLEDSIDFIDTSIVEEKTETPQVIRRREGDIRRSYVELRNSRERDSLVIKDLVINAISKPSSRRSQERLITKSATSDRVFSQPSLASKPVLSQLNKIKTEPQRTTSLDQVDVKLPDTALTSQFGSAPLPEKDTTSHLWAGVERKGNVRTLSEDELSTEPTTNFQKESMLNKLANILGSPRKRPVKSPTSPKSPASPKSPGSPVAGSSKDRVPKSLHDAEEMLLETRDEADRFKIEQAILLNEKDEELLKKHQEIKDKLVDSLQQNQSGPRREETVGLQASLLSEMLDTVETQEKLKSRKKGFFSRFRF